MKKKDLLIKLGIFVLVIIALAIIRIPEVTETLFTFFNK